MEKKIKIASATRYSYLIKSVMDIEPQIIETPSFRREYDQDGNIIEEIIFAPDGSVSDHYIMGYKDGILANQTLIIDDEIAEKQFFKYRDNLEIEVVTEYADGSTDKTEKIYDSLGRMISSVTRDDDGITEKVLVSYGGEKEVRTEFYDEEGERVKVVKEILNENLMPVEVETDDILSEEITVVKSEWAIDGLITKSENFKNGQLVSVSQVTYNENRQFAKRITETAEGVTIFEVEYDDLGREIRQVETNEEGEINLLINREYNEFGQVSFSSVEINNHGKGYDQKYDLKYDYEYF